MEKYTSLSIIAVLSYQTPRISLVYDDDSSTIRLLIENREAIIILQNHKGPLNININ